MIFTALLSVNRFKSSHSHYREQTIKQKNVDKRYPTSNLFVFKIIKMKTIYSKHYFVSIIKQCKQNHGMDSALLLKWKDM